MVQHAVPEDRVTFYGVTKSQGRALGTVKDCVKEITRNHDEKLHMIFFTAALCFAFASTAYAATSDFFQLLGNKEFWSCFNWGKFTESKLYKATQWREPDWPHRTGVTITNCYTIEIPWPELDIDKVTVYEDSGIMTSHDEPKDLKRITAVSGKSKEDYQRLVRWGSENFGDPHTKDLISEDVIGERATTTLTSLWTVGKTKVSITAEDFFFRGNHSCLTKLQFEKNGESSPATESCK